MGTASGKRVTAKEAADILGVPAHLISRLDVEGRVIKRFKLTSKAHVYDLRSMYKKMDASVTVGRVRRLGSFILT